MASFSENFGKTAKDYIASIPKSVLNLTSDLLENSDFISRTIGTNKSYEDIMFIIQSMGREPISLLGKDYIFIYDHVRRNYLQGTQIENRNYGIPKFTFYKEKPTIRFANPDSDPLNLLDKWMPEVRLETTSRSNILYSYAESDDEKTQNKQIGSREDENLGVNFGRVYSFSNRLTSKDLLRKTNEDFQHGKYRTLIARFHTNSEDSKSRDNAAQTAVSGQYGMSHGRNLLKINRTDENGYDNPYCRVWTYHHQYDRMTKAIRPFIEDTDSQEALESMEQVGDYDTVGFRTSDVVSSAIVGRAIDGGIAVNNNTLNSSINSSTAISSTNIIGGSKKLDKYGVLNYKTGFVNIAPTAKILDYFHGKEDDAEKKAVSIKRCMFSIENLAWKNNGSLTNEYNATLSPEQRGPLGGRIMWFPPYDISFNEESRVEWNGNQFIGRGEKIYTYTNTERTGNLSFTLLIDHPSILDYWTGHARNGMKNQGVSLIPGNGGGVDTKDNQENTLLRFFAGCEVLSAKPQEYWKRKAEVKEEELPQAVPTQQVTTPPAVTETPSKSRVICCCVYYPNNYSGVDDDAEDAVNYLMNGIGTGYLVNMETGLPTTFSPLDDIELSITLDPSDVFQASVKANTPCSGKNNCIEACDENGIIDTANTSNIADLKLGYEVYPQERGISIVTKALSSDTAANKAFACLGAGVKARYITDASGTIRYAIKMEHATTHKVTYWPLAKINGPSKKQSWYYRVDKAYEKNKLSKLESYIDEKSFGLNGVNFGRARNEKRFELPEDSDDFTLISFSDLYIALRSKNSLDNVKVDPINENKIEELKKVFSSDDNGYTLTDIHFKGHASYQGYSKSNNTLSKNRAETIKKWLSKKGVEIPSGEGKGKVEILTQAKGATADTGSNSTEPVKLWRSCSVYICYDVKDTKPAATSQQSNDNHINITIPSSANTKSIIPPGNYSVSIFGGKKINLNVANQEDDQRALMQRILSRNNGFIFDNILNNLEEEEPRIKKKPKIGGYEYDTATTETRVVNRYDNEGEFFELLDKTSPFMHNLITDKIKYFDPAYHSISPEGFNARLTFLHQCTRQGSTAENANFETSSAYNLAFGRPPVCVLRLGDFFYTKIIINSLSIQYENPTWDLNPEGIGVMPMFAKINISFAFIGGSDLAGPIARLQNAVSFNYYANTSIYDNRADRVEYNPNNSGEEIKLHTIDFINEAASTSTELNNTATPAATSEPLRLEKVNGVSIAKRSSTPTLRDPQIRPVTTTNQQQSNDSGQQGGGNGQQQQTNNNLNEENQALVNSWKEAHPQSMTKKEFEDIMSGLYNEALAGNISSITLLESILIENGPHELLDNPSEYANIFVNKETCTNADINYIKEQYMLLYGEYGSDKIGSVYINGNNYLLDIQSLSQFTN